MLIALSTQAAFASDFICQKSYVKKFEKMEDSLEDTVVVSGTAGTLVGLGLGLNSLLMSSFTPLGYALLSAPALLFPAGLIGGFAFVFSYGLHHFIVRPESLKDAYHLQEMLKMSYSEVLQIAENQRSAVLEQAIEKFDNQTTHQDFVDQIVKKINKERLQNGEAHLSDEEALKLARSKMIDRISDQKIKINNPLTEGLAYAKNKKAVPNDMSYEEFRLLLKDNQKELFCPKGKGLTLRKAIRRLKRL